MSTVAANGRAKVLCGWCAVVRWFFHCRERWFSKFRFRDVFEIAGERRGERLYGRVKHLRRLVGLLRFETQKLPSNELA